MAIGAEVGVGPAPESGERAAEIALELHVSDAVLHTVELFADAKVDQPAVLAHQLFLFHFILLLVFVDGELGLAVDIATEERTVAARALIELTRVQSIIEWLLVEAVSFVIKSWVPVHFVSLYLFEGHLSESNLQNAHSLELHTDFRDTISPLNLMLAARALHEVEGDSLGTPAVAEKLSDAVGVEDVPAV